LGGYHAEGGKERESKGEAKWDRFVESFSKEGRESKKQGEVI